MEDKRVNNIGVANISAVKNQQNIHDHTLQRNFLTSFYFLFHVFFPLLRFLSACDQIASNRTHNTDHHDNDSDRASYSVMVVLKRLIVHQCCRKVGQTVRSASCHGKYKIEYFDRSDDILRIHIARIGFSIGTVILKNFWIDVAPSIAAASYTSSGMVVRPAKIITM